MSDLWNPTRLATAFGAVRTRAKTAGVDGVTPERYAKNLSKRIERLSQKLELGDYKPSRLLRLKVPKSDGKARLISIPTVEDRIVIELLRNALEPRLEKLFSEAAFAYRPRRSARHAVRQVEACIKDGASWVALGDIERFFDRIPVDRIVQTVREIGVNAEIVAVLSTLLQAHATEPGKRPPVGVPQGSSLSPALSNLVLTPLDRQLTAIGFRLIRYSDNLCILTGSKADARRADALVHTELQKLGLRLKSDSRKVIKVTDGFAWLGFWIGPDGASVSEGAVRALAARADHALRDQHANPEQILLPIVRGWVQYFDGPLPDGMDLGPHHDLLKKLVRQCQPEPSAADDAIEPWQEDEETSTMSHPTSSLSPKSPNCSRKPTLRPPGLITRPQSVSTNALEKSSAWRKATTALLPNRSAQPSPWTTPTWTASFVCSCPQRPRLNVQPRAATGGATSKKSSALPRRRT